MPHHHDSGNVVPGDTAVLDQIDATLTEILRHWESAGDLYDLQQQVHNSQDDPVVLLVALNQLMTRYERCSQLLMKAETALMSVRRRTL